MTIAKRIHGVDGLCFCKDCDDAFMIEWRAQRKAELAETPIDVRRSWYPPAIVAIVDEVIAAGGIRSNEDYDRFYDQVMALSQRWVTGTDEDGDETFYDRSLISIRQAEILYAAMTGTDEMDLPSPKWQREKSIETKAGDIIVYGKPAEYEPEYMYGLFRRGAAHIVHGPSGTGKTTLLLELEDAGRRGTEFLGYKGPAIDPLFIIRDRPLEDYYETLDGLGLPHDFVRMEYMPMDIGWNNVAAQRISNLIERHDRPSLVVVEGLDQTIENLVKRSLLIPQLNRMQEIAKHYGCALVGTWGAPKRQSNPREAYMNSRDAAAGGGDLARLTGMMVGLQFEYERYRHGQMHRGKTGRIHVSIEPRKGAPRYKTIKRDAAGRMRETGIDVRFNQGDGGDGDGMGYREQVAALEEKLAQLKSMSEATFYRHKQRS